MSPVPVPRADRPVPMTPAEVANEEGARLHARAIYLNNHPDDISRYEQKPSRTELARTRESLTERLRILLDHPGDAALEAAVDEQMAAIVRSVTPAYDVLDRRWRDAGGFIPEPDDEDDDAALARRADQADELGPLG